MKQSKNHPLLTPPDPLSWGVETAGGRILITGASRGLGRALALELAEDGNELILTGRSAELLGELSAEVESKGAKADVHLVEFASQDSVFQFAGEIAAKAQNLDVVIHNAADIKVGLLSESEIGDLDWHYSINLKAPIILTRTLLPLVQKAQGQFVFINSVAGLIARKGSAYYAATKHGLKAVADSLREEVAKDNVSVLSVFPGRINTPMQERVMAAQKASANVNSFLQPASTARTIKEAMEKCRHGMLHNLKLVSGESPTTWLQMMFVAFTSRAMDIEPDFFSALATL